MGANKDLRYSVDTRYFCTPQFFPGIPNVSEATLEDSVKVKTNQWLTTIIYK